MSDLIRIKHWWKTLSSDAFVALEAPTRSRYTQSDGHDDFVEWADRHRVPRSASFAYWHWQSHERAFDKSGELRAPLLLHWGNDHATVRAGLGAGPDGYEITDHGANGAFSLDRAVVRDAGGFPDPTDAAGVRQWLEEVNTPLSRARLPYPYRPLTAAEQAWLHERMTERSDVDSAAGYLTALELRDQLTRQEAERFGDDWRTRYDGRLKTFPAWRLLFHACVRHDLPLAWESLDALGESGWEVLGEVPTEYARRLLHDAALGGNTAAIEPWLQVAAVLDGGATEVIPLIVGEVAAAGPQDAETWDALALAVMRQFPVADSQVVPVKSIRFSLDEQFPRPLRQAFARRTGNDLPALRERIATLAADAELTPGITASQALSDIDEFRVGVDELLAGSGPVLTGYEGGLTGHWADYRTLSADDIAWLRERVADPTTQMQGLGFCLELLYAHGVAGAAEVDALAPRWRKDLAKKYATTYTEWRHPLVTLTCLALDLDHPLAEKLLAWWNKPLAAWKSALAPMTGLGAPTQDKAAALWQHIISGEHDTGQLMTWVLLQARLDGVPPIQVADGLLNQDPLPVRPYVLNRVVVGVVDPAQPLWHYAIGHSPSWWSRLVELADNPDVSPKARSMALEQARTHRMITAPEHMRPAPPESAVAEARAWLARHPEA